MILFFTKTITSFGTMTKKSGAAIIKKLLLVIGFLILIALVSVPFVLPGIVKSKLIDYIEENSANQLQIESIAFTGLFSIELSAIDLKPKLEKEAFNKLNGYESDWIHFNSKSIQIYGIRWRDLLFDNKVFADHIVLDYPNVYVYRDKRVEDAPFKYIPLPSQVLRNATFSITIPLVEIKQGHISYEEHPKDKDSSSTITFDHLYGSAYHISTDSLYMTRHPEIILDGKGSILDSINAEIRYTSNVWNKNDLFRFEATVGAFSASHLNQVILPLTGTSFEQGHINKTTFFFEANDDVANGEMVMDYENLELSVHADKTGIKTFIANIFIKENDRKSRTKAEQNEEIHQTGEIHFERRKDRFIFNYWWGAIKSGLIPIITHIEEIPKKKSKE